MDRVRSRSPRGHKACLAARAPSGDAEFRGLNIQQVVPEQTDSLCEDLIDPTCGQIEASRNPGYWQVLVIIHC
jgi:hypothetical protein